MIQVSMPELPVTSEAFYDAVVPTTTPLIKRERLVNASGAIAQLIRDYRSLATDKRLADLSVAGRDLGDASPVDFETLYKSFLQKKTSVGRVHYDLLMEAHDQRICPYCGTRKAKTIDHFLPQESFPQLSITFENLVASCIDCNTIKNSLVALIKEEMLFHPYYESFPGSDWLHAEINREAPITLEYRVGEEARDRVRVQHHFETLRLAEIFAFHAANELSTSSGYFKKLARIDSSILRAHLIEIADSARDVCWYPWKPVLYQTLANDEWFCNEGFVNCS
jgi:HNH endonuclease